MSSYWASARPGQCSIHGIWVQGHRPKPERRIRFKFVARFGWGPPWDSAFGKHRAFPRVPCYRVILQNAMQRSAYMHTVCPNSEAAVGPSKRTFKKMQMRVLLCWFIWRRKASQDIPCKRHTILEESGKVGEKKEEKKGGQCDIKCICLLVSLKYLRFAFPWIPKLEAVRDNQPFPSWQPVVLLNSSLWCAISPQKYI